MSETEIKTRKGGGRLLKSVVEAREADAIILFRGGAKASEVQAHLKERYGKQMRAKRLYELKNLVDRIEVLEEPLNSALAIEL